MAEPTDQQAGRRHQPGAPPVADNLARDQGEVHSGHDDDDEAHGDEGDNFDTHQCSIGQPDGRQAMAREPAVVLVVGSGARHYREYLLAGAARRHRLWLLDAAEPTWQRRYVVGSSVVPLLDRARLVPDQAGLVAAAQEVAARREVAGVFSYDETLVVATAHVAHALGLPGATPDGIENCRDKYRSRCALRAAGLPQPRFAFVSTVDDAAEAAARIGFPVVLKPRGMGASIGVVRAGCAGDVPAAFEVAHAASYGGNPAYEGGVLVEEMLAGPEVSVDGAVVGGDYVPLFVARKTVGLAPYFEEVGHVVDAADPLLADPAFVDVLVRAHRATGYRYGMTHTEVMLTRRGPAVVEVNGRLGGDLIPHLGALATGLDPGDIAADVATATAAGTVPTRCAGWPGSTPTSRVGGSTRSGSPTRWGSTPGTAAGWAWSRWTRCGLLGWSSTPGCTRSVGAASGPWPSSTSGRCSEAWSASRRPTGTSRRRGRHCPTWSGGWNCSGCGPWRSGGRASTCAGSTTRC